MQTRNATFAMARRYLLTMESVECTDLGFGLQRTVAVIYACQRWRNLQARHFSNI